MNALRLGEVKCEKPVQLATHVYSCDSKKSHASESLSAKFWIISIRRQYHALFRCQYSAIQLLQPFIAHIVHGLSETICYKNTPTCSWWPWGRAAALKLYTVTFEIARSISVLQHSKFACKEGQ